MLSLGGRSTGGFPDSSASAARQRALAKATAIIHGDHWWCTEWCTESGLTVRCVGERRRRDDTWEMYARTCRTFLHPSLAIRSRTKPFVHEGAVAPAEAERSAPEVKRSRRECIARVSISSGAAALSRVAARVARLIKSVAGRFAGYLKKKMTPITANNLRKR
jgi:hypothetical protein